MNENFYDEAIDFFGNLIEEIGRQPHVVNHERVKEFEHAYKLVCKAAKDSEATITYSLERINIGMASITVIGKDLQFDSPKVFVEAARFASNVNIYPRTDGMVRTDLTFYNMATAQEEE